MSGDLHSPVTGDAAPFIASPPAVFPLRRFIFLLTLGLLAGAGPPGEYQVKAVFLYNFAQFVEWPESAFADPDTPFSICVLGEDPFGAQLDNVVQGESVAGRPLTVRRMKAVEEAGGCHILFISTSESANLARIHSALRDRSVLTVSDMEAFVSRGGMVRLFTESKRIRLRIGLTAVSAAGLTISSKLLRLAEIVPQEGS